jgi:hypothetical protein
MIVVDGIEFFNQQNQGLVVSAKAGIQDFIHGFPVRAFPEGISLGRE